MANQNGAATERFYTIKGAARELNIPYWKINYLAKAGVFPVYRPHNSRRLVRLTEVVAYIENCSVGGSR